MKAIKRGNDKVSINMHGYGVRTYWGLKMYLHETKGRCRVWRENKVRQKLHRSMENKEVKVMKTIVTYFKYNW